MTKKLDGFGVNHAIKRDWSDYNQKMKILGDITIWLSSDVINQWLVADRHYDRRGAPLLFCNMAIMTV